LTNSRIESRGDEILDEKTRNKTNERYGTAVMESFGRDCTGIIIVGVAGRDGG